jgi:hypothetical protein
LDDNISPNRLGHIFFPHEIQGISIPNAMMKKINSFLKAFCPEEVGAFLEKLSNRKTFRNTTLALSILALLGIFMQARENQAKFFTTKNKRK